MEIAKNQYCPVGIYGQRIDPFSLQVHLPVYNTDSARRGQLLGRIQTLSRPVAANYLQTFPGQKNAILAVTASEIQDGSRQSLP